MKSLRAVMLADFFVSCHADIADNCTNYSLHKVELHLHDEWQIVFAMFSCGSRKIIVLLLRDKKI